tara:strand:+ start:163 stop:3438 length:3276 start_codon:yes stop_codon:yes gene_type:complete
VYELLSPAAQAREEEALPLIKLHFVIFFQELYVFQLKFCRWSAFGLHPSDAPKRKTRQARSAAKDQKRREQLELKEAKLEQKRLKEQQRHEKVRSQRREQFEAEEAKQSRGPRGRRARASVALALERERKAAAAVDKSRQEAERVKIAAEAERILKFRVKQAERQGERKERYKWHDYDDHTMYEDATSDPYLIFQIDPPAFPSCKMLRTGGYFGRSTRTDVMTNTLNPRWDEARAPLYYLGTRSELENEMLHIQVYDWDMISRDDLIGEVRVPLTGLLEEGHIQLELTRLVEDRQSGLINGKRAHMRVPAGKILGLIKFDGEFPQPQYRQVGLQVQKVPGITYLAVRICRASKLMPADLNGLSDAYASVEWDGRQQSTRVIYNSLNPEWEETLYFPISSVAFTKEALEKKTAVSIRIYDMDEAGDDLLGSCVVPLHEITAAEHGQVDDDIDFSTRVAHRGRVLEIDDRQLTLVDFELESTIDLKMYFTPDLSAKIVLEPPTKRGRGMIETYEQQLGCWWEGSVPGHIRDEILFLGMDAEEDVSDVLRSRSLVCAIDQDGTEHLMCEYLQVTLPPLGFDAMALARLVRCITWSKDDETFLSALNQRDADLEVWQSPNNFIAVSKGDVEDHALLLANLFLGLGLDVYVCVGRLHGAPPKEKRHVWLLTREADCSVRMWEVTSASFFELPQRWHGSDTRASSSAPGRPAYDNGTDAPDNGHAELPYEKRAARGFSWFKRSSQRLRDESPPRADRMATGATAGTAAGEGMQMQPVHDAKANGASMPLLPAPADEPNGRRVHWVDGDDHDPEEDESSLIIDSMLVYAEPETDGGVLDSTEIEAGVADVAYPFVDEAMHRASRTAQAPTAESTGETNAQKAEKKGPPPVRLPYSNIEVIFNHQNLWISRTHLDPARLQFNLEMESEWVPFLTQRMRAEGLPKGFYQPRPLRAKVADDRLQAIQAQIQNEIKKHVRALRDVHATQFNQPHELVEQLDYVLELHEQAVCGEGHSNQMLDKWQRRIREKAPRRTEVSAKAVNYTYSDAKRVCKHIMGTFDQAALKAPGTEFLLAVRAFSYPGHVCSVWVYFGTLVRVRDD